MKRERLDAALKACGAVLARTGKHQIWHLPNGTTLVISVTPSDKRAEQNALSDLRKQLARPRT